MRGNTISIELPLKRGKVSKTIPLYQYDYGQKLLITGAELPEYYEVHFSNEMHGEAVTSIGDSTGVLIPDALLATGENVYLWLYLHADSDDGETEFQGAIPVIKRAQVTDQTPTPAEQSVITQAIAALTAASAEATEAKEDAEAAQQHIENMGVAATTLPTDSDATVTKTVNASGEVTLTFGLPRGVKGDRGDRGLQGETGNDGEDGEDGFSPVVYLTKSGKVTTFSVTDAEDTYSVEINDGEDGNPGQDATPDLITVDYSDLTFPVAAGTMCYHSGLLYKANQAIATSEEWTAAHWTQTTIEEEHLSLKTEINSVHQVPSGGSSGQVLGKASGTDYDVEWKTVSGGGTVDSSLSDSSTNPVQNKVITGVINQISDKNVSQNLYDKSTCNPQDKTVYNNRHAYASNNSYAVTGKIPVRASTKYKFWAGEGVNIKYVAQWSGESGDTFVSETNISSAAFTTGANTTFVEFEIFARSHTTDEYNAAIDCAMLVEGETVPETYQPYGQVTYVVPTDALEDAEAVEGAKNYTVMKSLVNLYDKTLARDNKVFNTTKLVDNTAYAFSGLIPVEPNAQYCYSIQKGLEYGYISAWYQRWDSSKAFIDEVQGNQSTNFLNQIQTTANTAYVSFCIYFGDSHTTEAFNTAIDTLMVVEGCQQPTEYVPYNLEPVMNHLKMDTMYRDNAERFKGKKWLAFGTSVTYQDSKYYTEGVADGEVVRGYIGDIVRRKPMIITNSGVSGSTLAGSDANALINRYNTFTYTDYDFVTIEYGINDFGNDVPVGTASDAAGTSTFAACLKTIIEYILNENPIVGLIICTDPDVRGTNKNNNDNTLKDYADVMLEIAAQYRMPVCDWFYHSGINSITKGNGSSRYFLTQAGTHPSVYGHMRMGAMLNQVFDSLLC